MSLEENTRTLLGLVEQYRETRCTEAWANAREVGEELLRQARREARRRVHEAILEVRGHADSELRAAAAALETHRRMYHQQHCSRLLEAVWTRLPAALTRRWQEPRARARWVDAALAAALDLLPREQTPWSVRHPPDWPHHEAAALTERLAEALGEDPAAVRQGSAAVHLVPDPKLHAGLIIAAGGAALDAGLEGLLSDKTGIEAHALGLLEEALRSPETLPAGSSSRQGCGAAADVSNSVSTDAAEAR
jgi:hypothetical protein